MGWYPPTTGALLQRGPSTVGLTPQEAEQRLAVLERSRHMLGPGAFESAKRLILSKVEEYSPQAQAAPGIQPGPQQQATQQQVLQQQPPVPTGPYTREQQRAAYVRYATQRALAQREVQPLIDKLQQEWPKPGTVRFDRWKDRKNKGFFGDKPNRTRYAKPGEHNRNIDIYDRVRRIDVPANTMAIVFKGKNFTGDQRVLGPGNYYDWGARSAIVLPRFAFNQYINEASNALSNFARPANGCLLNAGNWQTHPLVKAFDAFMDKIIAAHEGTPLADEYRTRKEQVRLSLSEDVLRYQAECALVSKPPCPEGLVRPRTAAQQQEWQRQGYQETPPGSACWKKPVICPEGTTRVQVQNEETRARLQQFGYEERPAGSGCWGKPKIECPKGATAVDNELVAQTLRASGYEENPPGSGCFVKPKRARQCKTEWYVFPNRERVCIPPNRYNPECLKKGGRYEANINTRTGKIRTDTIACMIPQTRRVAMGAPFSPQRAAWYEDIKRRAVYPRS